MCCPDSGICFPGEPCSDDYEDYYGDLDTCTAEFHSLVFGKFLENYDKLVTQEDPNFCLVKRAGNTCEPRANCITFDPCKYPHKLKKGYKINKKEFQSDCSSLTDLKI